MCVCVWGGELSNKQFQQFYMIACPYCLFMNLSIAESASAIRAAAGFVAWDPDTFAIICV